MRKFVKRASIDRLLILACMFCLAALTPASATGDYRLGPRDKIFVRVVEWRPSVDKIVAWDDINREYIVSANGIITIPLIGRLNANGVTTDELAQKISLALQKKMNLVTTPDATVEVTEYRPFFILGIVSKPGEYAFRPGLTVLQALSLGGGVFRSTGADTYETDRSRINADSEIRALGRELSMLELQQYRLRSAQEEKPEIQFPADFVKDLSRLGNASSIDRAQTIYKTHRQEWELKLKGLTEEANQAEKERNMLSRQVELKRKELKFIAEEKNRIGALLNSKLVNHKEDFEIRQLGNAVEAELVAIEIESSQAKSRLEKAKRDIQTERGVRQRTISEELEAVESNIRQVAEKLHTSKILRKSLASGMDSGANSDSQDNNALAFRIIRMTDGLTSEFNASSDHPVKPGDVIKVQLRREGEAVEAPNSSNVFQNSN